jgi:polysaccharide pyruvyl transferase WcaK-like protein
MKIAIIGYYGHNNLGDELNLLEMIKLIKTQYPNAEITVFSGGLGTLYYPVDYNLVLADRLGIDKYRETLNTYDLIIIGGGGLVFLGANYFDFLQEGIKTPYIFSRVGIDDRVVSKPVLAQLKDILGRAHDVTVRTSYDKALLEKHLGLSCGVIPEAIWNYRAQPFPLAAHGKKILVSMNAYAARFFTQVRDALTRMKTARTTFTVSMQDTSRDFHYNILSTPENRTILPESVSLHRKASFLAAADLVITSRLHAGLVAISHGVPAVMLKSTPKVHFLMKELGLNELYAENGINEAMLDGIFSKDMRPRLLAISEQMKALSKVPIIPEE